MAKDGGKVTLNVRGLNNYKKRRTIFNWIKRKNFDIVCVQETHSSKKDEPEWKKEWGGDVLFSHGASNSRGVMVLFRNGFEYSVNSKQIYLYVRYIVFNSICSLLSPYI
jgi:exonuclease III